MEINKLCKLSHKEALKKGWYPKEGRNVGELIALIHSELSEALEEARDGKFKTYFKEDKNGKQKPEGFGIEVADAVIRIADMCGYLGIDLEKALKTKLAYNKTRSHKHGGKIF